MKRLAIAALAALALPAAAQLKDAAVAVQESDAVVTVTKVDAAKRVVTFRGPRGNVATLKVPPESQNLDQVKPGQQYRMKYVEAVAVAVRVGGEAAALASEEVRLAPKGAKPGGMMVRTQQVSGVVDAIDYAHRYIAMRGPRGNTLVYKVADNVPLQELGAGDRIVVTHTEALAIEMVEQPARKSP